MPRPHKCPTGHLNHRTLPGPERRDAGIDLLRPARRGEEPRAGARFFKPPRQVIKSINDTRKGQLDLERHGGRTRQASPHASSSGSWP
jgi:hypothetical protein